MFLSQEVGYAEYVERNDNMENLRFKRYDISEFYDYLKSLAGTYVRCFGKFRFILGAVLPKNVK